jgi:hypothetical protein
MKPKPFAELLRAWQGQRTAEQAAAALGVNRRTFENWLIGRYVPRPFVQSLLEKQIAAPPPESAQEPPSKRSKPKRS